MQEHLMSTIQTKKSNYMGVCLVGCASKVQNPYYEPNTWTNVLCLDKRIYIVLLAVKFLSFCTLDNDRCYIIYRVFQIKEVPTLDLLISWLPKHFEKQFSTLFNTPAVAESKNNNILIVITPTQPQLNSKHTNLMTSISQLLWTQF